MKLLKMIRKANLADIPNIAEILVTTWQTCYQSFLPKSFLNSLSVDKQIQRHQKIMGRGIDYFVYENAQKTVEGFASYGKTRTSNLPAPIELYTIYVHPKSQGKQVGQQLLNQVIQSIPEVKSICVEVMAANPYRSFYQKNGFQFYQKTSMDLGEVQIENWIFIKKLNHGTDTA